MKNHTVRITKQGLHLGAVGIVTDTIRIEEAIALQITFFNTNLAPKWFFESSIEFI